MSSEAVRYTAADGVATATLNRPEKRNALDAGTVAALRDAHARAEEDAAVRVFVVRGAGKDFCAGADLAQLERIAMGAGPLENLAEASAIGDLLVAFRRGGKPVVAVVQGNAVAGGAGLASACDVVLAREDARFGYPEVRLGFVPAMVMALLRRSLGEKKAFELVTRGDRIDAVEAERLGLVTRVFPAASFDADVRSYVAELADRSASAVRLTKRLLYGMDGLSFEEAVARGAEVNVLARYTEDCREGVRQFLERRAEG